MPSRRSVLGGVAGLAGIGVAASSQLRPDGRHGQTPSPGTWPLRRYGAANAAWNRSAAIPARPTVTWTNDPLGSRFDIPATLVVGPESVYVAGDGVAALARDDGTIRWQADVPGGPIGIHGGTVFVAPHDSAPATDASALRAFRADGEEVWSRSLAPGAVSLVGAGATVFVGGEASLSAFDAGDGTRRWSIATAIEPRVLVSDGHLHAASESVARYRPRSLLERGLGSGPATAWHTAGIGFPHALAATATRIVGGFRNETGTQALVAFDPSEGTVRWRAFGEPTDRVAPLAVGAERCVFGRRFLEGDTPRFEVASRRLADGAHGWRTAVDQRVTDIALVDGTVVVATAAVDSAEPPGGTVRGLRLEDGTEDWRVTLETGVAAVAPVDGVLFGTTARGRVFALD